MKKIKLSQNQESIIDDEDFNKINRYKWSAAYAPSTKSFYAVSRFCKYQIKMHRFILGLNNHDKRQIDHINHNTLDNRKQNLKIVNNRKNAENRKDKSKYGTGISFRKYPKQKPYHAQLQVNGKKLHLGCFSSIEEAQECRKQYIKNNIHEE